MTSDQMREHLTTEHGQDPGERTLVQTHHLHRVCHSQRTVRDGHEHRHPPIELSGLARQALAAS